MLCGIRVTIFRRASFVSIVALERQNYRLAEVLGDLQFDSHPDGRKRCFRDYHISLFNQLAVPHVAQTSPLVERLFSELWVAINESVSNLLNASTAQGV